MKKLIFSTVSNKTLENIWLLVFRICAGSFMLIHGLPKLNKILTGDFTFVDPLGVGEELSLFMAVFAEVFCAVLLVFGLGTRVAAFFLVITMGVAAFLQHADDPFNVKEMALLYLLIYLNILIFGPGRYSIDKLLK
jgi:putative oxidoreductase